MHQANFLAPLPGTKEEYFQRLKKTSRVNMAPAANFLAPLPGRKKTSARGVFVRTSFTFFIALLYFIYFTCIILYQKPKKI
jgi:hypothetical protein